MGQCRRFFGLCVALLFLAYGPGARADVLVAPNANAGANGDTGTVLVFGSGSGNTSTLQWSLAASQLTAMQGATITGIGFRLPGDADTITTDTTVGTWDLQLSGSLNPIGSLDPTPANNIAPDAVTVFDAALVIPANSLVGGAGPNPFFVITFTTPFTYTGGDLLMTLVEPNTANVLVDANSVDANGDTAGCNPAPGCRGQFFNYPTTEFVFSGTTTPVPEPPSLLLIMTAICLLTGFAVQRVRQTSTRA
jgi:hypothetical protein